MQRFASQLHADSPGSILGSTTTWEELEIQEEAESGSSVTSKIRLPVQVRTWGVLLPRRPVGWLRACEFA